jgi:hypothetical protein
MTFQAVLSPREDGDYDVIAAYNVETLAKAEKSALQLAQDFLQWEEVDKQALIMEMENVTDVIESDLVGMPIKANWNFTLEATCPACIECVDVTAVQGFFDDKTLDYGEYGTKNSTNIDAECPLCGHKFKITCEFS